MDELYTSGTDLITCPWCGYEEQDSFEISDGNFDCNECGKTYRVDHDITVTYSTSKVVIEEKQNG